MKQQKSFDVESILRNALTGHSRRLSHVYRYTTSPCNRKENVAEHCYYVCFLSFVIGRQFKQMGCIVDMESLYERAILHDLDEALTGDIIRSVKHGFPGLKSALNDASEVMMDHLSRGVQIDSMTDIWRDSKEGVEGHIIHLCDLLTVVSYVIEEILFGNRHLKPTLLEVRKALKGYLKKIQHILNNTGGYHPSHVYTQYPAERGNDVRFQICLCNYLSAAIKITDEFSETVDTDAFLRSDPRPADVHHELEEETND